MFIFIYTYIYVLIYHAYLSVLMLSAIFRPSVRRSALSVAHASATSALKLPLGHSLDGLHKP